MFNLTQKIDPAELDLKDTVVSINRVTKVVKGGKNLSFSALVVVGDGHGVQGDGEVCVTAIETGLIGTFELHVRHDMTIEWPMAETPTHFMTMAFDPDLDDAVVIALRDMIKLICARTGLSREDAYTLCSLAADLRITQVVNGSKGIHVMLEKTHLA